MPTISFDDLKKLIDKFDAELAQEGVPVIARPMQMIGKMSDHFKCRISMDDEICKLTLKVCDSLYPQQALIIKPLMTGIFLFKGCIFKACIPLSFGSIRFGPEDIIKDMPDLRRAQLFSSRKEYGRYILSAFDLIDLAWGFYQLFQEKKLPSNSLALIKNGKDQLESAASAALQSRQYAAAMHSGQIAIELIIKGALVRSGLSEEELKRIGHDHRKLAKNLCDYYLNLEEERVLKLLEILPADMNARYADKTYTENEIGQALMAVQKLSAQILRLISTCNIRHYLVQTGQRINLRTPISKITL